MNSVAPAIPQPPAAVMDNDREEVGAALFSLEAAGANLLTFLLFDRSLKLGFKRDGIAHETRDVICIPQVLVSTFLVTDRMAALRSLSRTLEELEIQDLSAVAFFNRAEGEWLTTARAKIRMGPLLSEANHKATLAACETRREWIKNGAAVVEQMLRTEPPPADE